MDYEDSAPIKVFLSLQWSSGKQRRLMAATNDRGWWRKRFKVLDEGLGEKTGEKHVFFVIVVILCPST